MRHVLQLVAAAAAVLALAAPAHGTLTPGSRATIDVSVATLWKAPSLERAIDRPSLGNPVDPVAWSRNLASTASRVWLDSRVQTQALYGQQVVVLAVRGGWAKVAVVAEPDPQDPHGYPGWLPLRQLTSGFHASGRAVVVLARAAPLRLPGRTLTLSYGTRLPLVGRSKDAAIVRTPDGTGSLPPAAVGAPLPYSGAAVVAQAKRFLGVRYLWGGLSAWGFDCSGLVWDVFRVLGRTIPRDADPQFRHGTPVARADLRPGDLLFWGTPSYVEHVAIYAGGGLMVEAPDSAHRVRLVPVRFDRWYVGARRY